MNKSQLKELIRKEVQNYLNEQVVSKENLKPGDTVYMIAAQPETEDSYPIIYPSTVTLVTAEVSNEWEPRTENGIVLKDLEENTTGEFDVRLVFLDPDQAIKTIERNLRG